MISLILLFTATVSGSIENSCTPVEGPKALKCYHKLVDLKDNAVALDLNQYENTQIINNLCKDFKNPCAIPLKCEAGKEVVDTIDKLVLLCDAVGFLSIEFLDCDGKLNTRNSTCVQEWNPFPDEVEDPVKMAEIQKESCQNFSGKIIVWKRKSRNCAIMTCGSNLKRSKMTYFLYFTILLIPIVLGDEDVVCIPTEGENREECVMIYNGVKDNILTLNLTELENIEKFKKNCLDFENCTPQLKCGAEKALVDTIDDIRSFCEASMFRHTKNFEECDDKLIEKNSTCIQEWHQLPELDSGDEEALKTACKEFFGKDGCLEKEMSEACGVDVWNGFKKKHNELLSQAGILDLKNDYNMRKINTTCTDFLKCSTQFKCGRTRKDVEEIDKAVFVCNFVAFLISPGFMDCVDKVDTKKSTCLQEWDPFPDVEGTEAENTMKQNEACRNFFGKDNCMEKEMLEMCGMDLWEDFRKHYLGLNKIFKACDFD